VNPKCIVCGRGIAKRTGTIWFRDPQVSYASPLRGVPDFPEKPDGHREQSGLLVTLYLANRPRTKDDVQRHTNDKVLRVQISNEGCVGAATTWDGESYHDKYFCRESCARKQGYASAAHGARFTWRS
jgi:hypothetical protein